MRLLPPVQVAYCLGCNALIRERKRRPCRTCGSLNRIVSRSADDGFLTSDKT